MKNPIRYDWRALVAAAIVCSAGISTAAWAHGAKHDAADLRPELSFGRSETYDYEPPAPGSYRLPPIKRAADGQVLDTSGRSRDLRALMDGRITVFAFIYTRCNDPQGCPLSLSLLYDLQYVAETDPEIGDSLRLMALSFDVVHDTPEVMAEFAGTTQEPKSASDLMFLTTASPKDLAPILKAYAQPIGVKADPADAFGPYTHQIRIFLIDRKGWIRNIYSLGFLDPRLVATDIRTLLLEEHDRVPGG